VPDFDVACGDHRLAVTYSPAGGAAVVALHGASNGTRDFFLYEHLHRVLPPAGIGVATFDRRGEGDSTGEPSRGQFALQVEDALAVANSLDVEHVGLWGYSQGGWVAPLAAAQSERIDFLILIASTGVTPAEQMMYATAEQLRRAGHSPKTVERALALRQAFDDWAHGRVTDGGTALEHELIATADEPWRPLAFLPPRLPDEPGRRRWVEEMDFDPTHSFEQVNIPTLLFYGADDAWTPIDYSIEAWRTAGGDDVEIMTIPNSSHSLTLPDGTLAPQYERKIVHWISTVCPTH